MNKTYSILRTHLTTTPCPFVYNSRLRNLLRQFSEKKKDPPKQSKKPKQESEGCKLCENILKQCDRCPEVLSRPECEKNVPGCMPFTEDVPMPQPQPQPQPQLIECDSERKTSSRKGPPRCPRPRSDTSPPESEKRKTTEQFENKKDMAKKPDGCK